MAAAAAIITPPTALPRPRRTGASSSRRKQHEAGYQQHGAGPRPRPASSRGPNPAHRSCQRRPSRGRLAWREQLRPRAVVPRPRARRAAINGARSHGAAPDQYLEGRRPAGKQPEVDRRLRGAGIWLEKDGPRLVSWIGLVLSVIPSKRVFDGWRWTVSVRAGWSINRRGAVPGPLIGDVAQSLRCRRRQHAFTAAGRC